jgi:NAD-dependent dihydropyrimidine dehydrogenase PreA subunit
MQQKYLKDVVSLNIDKTKCVSCGVCVEVCPHGVIEMEQKRAIIKNKDACMECGACKMNCAFKAIEVKKGVGCAAGIIKGFIRGTEPTCDCFGANKCC